MSKHAALEIVSKIFGLYCIVQFIRSTPAVIGAIVVDNPEFVTNKALHAVLMSLYPLIFLLLSFIFIRKTEFIVKLIESKPNNSDSTESILSQDNSAYSKLSFWIIILGIFYFISAASVFLIGIGTLAIRLREGWFLTHDPLLPQTIILILSLICIFRSEQVAELIETKRKKLNKSFKTDG